MINRWKFCLCLLLLSFLPGCLNSFGGSEEEHYFLIIQGLKNEEATSEEEVLLIHNSMCDFIKKYPSSRYCDDVEFFYRFFFPSKAGASMWEEFYHTHAQDHFEKETIRELSELLPEVHLTYEQAYYYLSAIYYNGIGRFDKGYSFAEKLKSSLGTVSSNSTLFMFWRSADGFMKWTEKATN